MKTLILTIILTGLLASGALAADVALPGTPAGERMADFIAAIRSHDPARHRAFIDDHWKPAPDEQAMQGRLNFFDIVAQDLGEFDVYAVEESEQHFIAVVLHAPDSPEGIEWVRLGLKLQPEPPHLVDMMQLNPADDPTIELPEPPITSEKLAAWLDDYLKKLVSEDEFSGSIALAKDGEIFYSAAFGEANKRYDVANKLDTKFNIGSMNKMFTGVAIMQLVADGRLSLDGTVGEYLPDYPNDEVKSKVTIRHLLSHRSGMASYWKELFDTAMWEIRSVREFAMLTAEEPLQFEPDEQFMYSNSGPVLLGLILEEVTGQNYHDYILAHVTGAAGMLNTDCYAVDDPVKNLAIGYERRPDGMRGHTPWQSNLYMHSAIGGPAGGGYSTAPDLIAFATALRRGTILDRQWVDTLWVERSPEAGYGFLFGVEMPPGEKIVGHGGGAPGINAKLDMYLDAGYDIAVMANHSGAASKVSRVIERILTGE